MQRWYNLWNPEQSQANTRWKLLPLSASVWTGSSNWAKSPREGSVLKASHRQAGSQPPQLPSKILDPFKKVHKTKKGTTSQLCLFIALGFLSFFCSKMRYSVSQRMRQTLCENILSHPFFTSLPLFTLLMLEHNQGTSTSLHSLH